MILRKPRYFDSFTCIAAQCPDSCCQQWDVQVDPQSAARYRSLPGPLGDVLRERLTDADGQTWLSIVDGRCPMWRADGLCRIQAELGAGALCRTCREFPRLAHDYGDFIEQGLELSCPEAARILLSAPAEGWMELEIPDQGEAEYDQEAMEVLLRTRSAALEILADTTRPVGEVLALLLLYGCQAQGELDGWEAAEFDPAAALSSGRELAKAGGPEEILEFFKTLEILTAQWQARLDAPCPGPWQDGYRYLARYFVERYWLQAVSDYDLYCRVKFAVISCITIRALGGALCRTAQHYSKEIENNLDNVEALLDGAYAHPAFTDDKLLGLLLK